MNKIRAYSAVVIALLALAGCADTMTSVKDTTKGWFSRSDEEAERTKPTELSEDFAPSINVQELWSERVGKGTDEYYLKLLPAPYKDNIYTADRNGRVMALTATSGAEVWSVQDEDRLISGGPGVGEGKVFVGTSDAEVVARDAETGKKLWVAKVSSEVLSAPRVAGGLVIVRTGDGNIYALNAENGMQKWVFDRSIPVLTLRGTASPVIYEGLILIGFDNGRLVTLDLETGKQVWEAELAQPSGRSDLERLVDIDGDPVIKDGTAYIGSFQGRIAAISMTDGSLDWTRDMSSYDVLAVDEKRVYVTDERGVVWALNRFDGSAVWRQKELRYRQTTGPTYFDGYIVVGDFEGYLHWLSAETGEIVGRERLDKERILTPPIDLGGALLGYSSAGSLATFRVD
ncbi:MAG: outer membrane protein assembly factor BamB [Gammaproteobacteria bacterium]|nr:outer membrane protein assembly factor BamB [Gammaproteobacteria bacterium]